jgi:hypothetical protein
MPEKIVELITYSLKLDSILPELSMDIRLVLLCTVSIFAYLAKEFVKYKRM